MAGFDRLPRSNRKEIDRSWNGKVGQMSSLACFPEKTRRFSISCCSEFHWNGISYQALNEASAPGSVLFWGIKSAVAIVNFAIPPVCACSWTFTVAQDDGTEIELTGKPVLARRRPPTIC
jgi:hypothetical protein